jgi:hypothetical protein
LAAGLREESSTYYADVLRDSELPKDADKADREVGTYAVVALDELAQAASTAAQQAGHVTELASALGRMPKEVAPKVAELLAANAVEWRAFLDSLPMESWVRKLLPARERSA